MVNFIFCISIIIAISIMFLIASIMDKGFKDGLREFIIMFFFISSVIISFFLILFGIFALLYKLIIG